MRPLGEHRFLTNDACHNPFTKKEDTAPNNYDHEHDNDRDEQDEDGGDQLAD